MQKPTGKRIVVTVDAEHFAALDRIKKETGAPYSFTIRKALEQFLKK